MGLLDIENIESNFIKAVRLAETRRHIARFLVPYKAVRCFVAEEQVDILAKKISEVWNLSNIKWRTPFAERLERDFISHHDEHKERTLLSLDCRTLK